jgi:NADH-quinone oxidoreductase subunit C
MTPELTAIIASFPDAELDSSGLDPRVRVPRDSYRALVAAFAGAGCRLSDVTAVDHMASIEIVVQLLASASEQFSVHCMVHDDDPRIDTLVPVFPSAEYAEREVFDLFGVDFLGHPDLSRVLLPDHFLGHPLRKEFGLEVAPW